MSSLQSAAARPSLKTLAARGVAQREAVPRRSLAELGDAQRAGRDPLGILSAQAERRVAELNPLRDERMSQSAFAFYRGTAGIMAADLAAAPRTGIMVPSCGDAHVANFGFFASPQRSLVFDLNDFDEAAWAPWEWDVKRLAASIVIAGGHTSRDAAVVERATRGAIASYIAALTRLVHSSPVDRYFEHFDATQALESLDKPARKALRQAMADAQKRTGQRAARRLTSRSEAGELRFNEAPPAMVRTVESTRERVFALMSAYRESTRVDVSLLIDHYRVADVARRAVGVGSVGTRCYLAALEDGDNDLLILQMKQASRSVLDEYGTIEQPFALQRAVDEHGQGARVVAMQRVLQALSDPLLGYVADMQGDDFYVRTFHDMKGGIDADTLDDGPFVTYAQACGVVLARAHAQGPRAGEIVGYIGGGKVITEALTRFAYDYAALSASDFDAFLTSRAQQPG